MTKQVTKERCFNSNAAKKEEKTSWPEVGCCNRGCVNCQDHLESYPLQKVSAFPQLLLRRKTVFVHLPFNTPDLIERALLNILKLSG